MPHGGLYSTEYATERLLLALDYGRKSAIVGIGFVWMPYGLVLGLFVLAAFIFVPYMFRRLLQLRWFGWVTAFALFVFAPLIASRFLFDGPGHALWSFAATVMPLLAFYLFTWILKFVLRDYPEDMRAQRMLDEAGVGSCDSPLHVQRTANVVPLCQHVCLYASRRTIAHPSAAAGRHLLRSLSFE